MGKSDFIRLMNPKSTKHFFEQMRPRDFPSNLKYLLFFAIPTFMGTFLLYGVLGFNISMTFGQVTSSASAMYPAIPESLILGIMDYIKWIAMPLIVGLLLSLLSQHLMGKKLSRGEAMTIAIYSYTPALIFNFLVAFSLIGIFASSIGGLYSAFLFVSAIKTKIKEKNAWVKAFVFSIVTSLLVLTLIGMIFAAATPRMHPVEKFTLFSKNMTITASSAKPSGIVNIDPAKCAGETDSFWRDDCYYNIAFDTDNAELCKLIADQETKDTCYIDVAYFSGKPYLCDNIADKDKVGECKQDALDYMFS